MMTSPQRWRDEIIPCRDGATPVQRFLLFFLLAGVSLLTSLRTSFFSVDFFAAFLAVFLAAFFALFLAFLALAHPPTDLGFFPAAAAFLGTAFLAGGFAGLLPYLSFASAVR